MGKNSGAMNVILKDGAKLAKKLKKLEEGGATAIERTVSEAASRAPAWVSKGIREHYGVDSAAIKEAEGRPKRGGTQIAVKGNVVDGLTLEYRGRTLTPTHFKQSPTTPFPKGFKAKLERVPGQAINTARGSSAVAMIRQPKKYTVKATIIKGQRVSMGGGAFITEANRATLPFQRTGERREPIEPIKTLSVPQMIDGRAHDTINDIINENLEKRFTHHISRVMK